MRKAVALVALTGAATLAACSGDDGGGSDASDLPPEEQQYVEAVMEEFDPVAAAPLTEDDVRCRAEAVVTGLGVERLEELEVSAERLAQPDLPGGVDEDGGCLDLTGLFVATIADGESFSAETKECLAGAFDEDLVGPLYARMLTEGEEAVQDDPAALSQVLSVLTQCPGAVDF